ncbi:glycosyltransferase [Leifsonia xyli subsp. xyli str. CTCB07]|uniref:Glycosyltransferase n=2 Tax=Leifsonia xyli subsp. xyli TaxID=59736 RepID=Q6AHD9_LEIXX|nr:glycosyltransferase [Leifsonia xyli subsp. xyli str. CTCB07]
MLAAKTSSTVRFVRLPFIRGEDGRTMRSIVIIPTYNEWENIGPVVGRLRASVPDADVLIVDDGSPDGTGDLADALAATDANVQVLHRAGKSGLGAAYRAGMTWALDAGYDAIVEMDADGSHQPEQLPRLLAVLRRPPGEAPGPGSAGADLVLGSRWVPGGGVVNWPAHRRLLSRGGSVYSRIALGVPARDVTGGYRAFTADALRSVRLDDVESQGYCFQIDMLRRVHAAGLTVTEVPITFVEREHGASKMTGCIVAEAMLRVTGWGIAGLPRRFRRRTVTPAEVTETAPQA